MSTPLNARTVARRFLPRSTYFSPSLFVFTTTPDSSSLSAGLAVLNCLGFCVVRLDPDGVNASTTHLGLHFGFLLAWSFFIAVQTALGFAFRGGLNDSQDGSRSHKDPRTRLFLLLEWSFLCRASVRQDCLGLFVTRYGSLAFSHDLRRRVKRRVEAVHRARGLAALAPPVALLWDIRVNTSGLPSGSAASAS